MLNRLVAVLVLVGAVLTATPASASEAPPWISHPGVELPQQVERITPGIPLATRLQGAALPAGLAGARTQKVVGMAVTYGAPAPLVGWLYALALTDGDTLDETGVIVALRISEVMAAVGPVFLISAAFSGTSLPSYNGPSSTRKLAIVALSMHATAVASAGLAELFIRSAVNNDNGGAIALGTLHVPLAIGAWVTGVITGSIAAGRGTSRDNHGAGGAYLMPMLNPEYSGLAVGVRF